MLQNSDNTQKTICPPTIFSRLAHKKEPKTQRVSEGPLVSKTMFVYSLHSVIVFWKEGSFTSILNDIDNK